MTPRFAVGDRVQARVTNPSGHTRLPRYARGRRGTVVACHGEYVLADESAEGVPDPARQPLYTVVFTADELWGDHAPEGDVDVHLDLWESYLEPVEDR